MNRTLLTGLELISILQNNGLYTIEGCIATTSGLKKPINEDRIGSIFIDEKLRICLCDGHWGEGAAQVTYSDTLNSNTIFPSDKDSTISNLQKIEKHIFDMYGNLNLNGVTDTTTETSMIAFEIENHTLRLVAYGDCRFFLLSKDYSFRAPMISSWIGSFSYLGLRQRLSLEKSTFFTELTIVPGDTILFFSDGIDECIYEKSTISFSKICEMARQKTPCKTIIKELLTEVYKHGAEDNASIGLLRIV